MKRKWFLLTLILLPSVLSASAPTFLFRHYTTRDGFSANTVRAMIQDHRGLMWFGTSDGLDSYDGREVVRHELDADRSAYVNALFEDSREILWAGTDDAVYYGDGTDFTCLEETGVAVTSFASDAQGNIWYATREKGIHCYDGEKIRTYCDGTSFEFVYVDSTGQVWACSISSLESLHVYNPATDTFQVPAVTWKDCQADRICAMVEDPAGHLWMGTWNSGVYRYDPETRIVTCPLSGPVGFNHIHTLTAISPWALLIGSDDGLFWYDPVTGEKELYSNDENDPMSLSNKFVYPVVQDHEGGLWVGTYYGGVDYSPVGAGLFRNRSLSSLTGAFETYTTSCFCEDPDGSLWIGSDNGGLVHVDGVTLSLLGAWTPEKSPRPLPSYNIHALERHGNDLWIGTYAGGAIRLDVKTGAMKTFSSRDGLDDSSVYSFLHDSQGNFWVGTMAGVNLYDPSTDRFSRQVFTGVIVSDIVELPSGDIWCASTGRGAFVRRASDGHWDNLTLSGGDIPSDYISCLWQSPDGRLFAGTKKGLVYTRDGRHFEQMDLGKPYDVLQVAFDGIWLWLATGKGLMRMPLAGGTPEHFGVSDGIFKDSFLGNAGLTASDGIIYMGTSAGFLSFTPRQIQMNRKVPTVLVTRFIVRNDQGEEVANRPRSRYSWRERNVVLTYAALSYSAPEKNNYAYILEGYDAVWHDAGNVNRTEYNRLSPGRYTFRVRASNNDGVWNEVGDSISFVIRPHPLLSYWAIVLYLLAFSVVLYLLAHYFVHRTEQRTHARYEQRLDEELSLVKEEEFDDRFRLVTTLAEEMEAPLQAMETQIEKIKEDPDIWSSVRAELSVIEKNFRRLTSFSGNLLKMRATLAAHYADGPMPQPEPSIVEDTEDFITRLDRIIAANLANPDLSVAMLASEMAVSRSGLFSKVKEATGDTPNSLIQSERLKAAAKLLSEGKFPVSEVCYMVGFSSPSYFSKTFARMYGKTPHEWMQAHKD